MCDINIKRSVPTITVSKKPLHDGNLCLLKRILRLILFFLMCSFFFPIIKMLCIWGFNSNFSYLSWIYFNNHERWRWGNFQKLWSASSSSRKNLFDLYYFFKKKGSPWHSSRQKLKKKLLVFCIRSKIAIFLFASAIFSSSNGHTRKLK